MVKWTRLDLILGFLMENFWKQFKSIRFLLDPFVSPSFESLALPCC